MSALSKCGVGAVLVAGACTTLFSDGKSHVLACAPVPVERSDGTLGRAYQVDDSAKIPADWTYANYVEGVGATCDAPPAGYTQVPGVLVDGQGHQYTVTFLANEQPGGAYLGVRYPDYVKG